MKNIVIVYGVHSDERAPYQLIKEVQKQIGSTIPSVDATSKRFQHGDPRTKFYQDILKKYKNPILIDVHGVPKSKAKFFLAQTFDKKMLGKVRKTAKPGQFNEVYYAYIKNENIIREQYKGRGYQKAKIETVPASSFAEVERQLNEWKNSGISRRMINIEVGGDKNYLEKASKKLIELIQELQ